MSQLDTSCEVFRWRGELSNGFCLRGAFLEARPSSEKSLLRLVRALGRAPKKSLPRFAVTLARVAKNQYLGFLTRILQSLTVPAFGRFCVNNTPVSLLPLHLFLAYLCATHASDPRSQRLGLWTVLTPIGVMNDMGVNPFRNCSHCLKSAASPRLGRPWISRVYSLTEKREFIPMMRTLMAWKFPCLTDHMM